MGLLSVASVSFRSEAELSRYLETLQRERASVEDFALSPSQNGRAPSIVTVFRGSGALRAVPPSVRSFVEEDRGSGGAAMYGAVYVDLNHCYPGLVEQIVGSVFPRIRRAVLERGPLIRADVALLYRALSGSGAQHGGPTQQIDTACLIS